MQTLTEEDYKAAEDMAPVKKTHSSRGVEKMSDKEFEGLLDKMKTPVNQQRELAVKVKRFLDMRIDEEMEERGYLSENTRKWSETYNGMLKDIQKALHGDKTVNLHLHKISQSQIATRVREANDVVLIG